VAAHVPPPFAQEARAMRSVAVLMRIAGAGLAMVLLTGQGTHQPPTIEKLVADGWEIAGYVAAWENRSLILFKNKNQPYLVQCSVLIDVMRNPRQVVYCYELH
jgi:hypothetical protein